MAITSLDIANQSFSIDRKGYDVDEVDVFLERVAEEIDALNAEIEDLRDEVAAASVAAPQAATETQAIPVIDTAAIEERDARIAALEAELAMRNERIAVLQSKLEDIPVVNDSAIAQALIVAQRSADEVVANANTQSEQIISDAKQDAENIISRAKEEKISIDIEIKELEVARDEARSQYQEILRNFINDATKKLGNLEERKAATSNRVAPDQTGRVMSKNQIPVAADATTAFTVAQENAVAAVVPTPSAVEKDLSGFGDADGFEFEELD